VRSTVQVISTQGNSRLSFYANHKLITPGMSPKWEPPYWAFPSTRPSAPVDREAETRKQVVPTPLPSVRPRSLSIPSADSLTTVTAPKNEKNLRPIQHTQTQTQSLFMTKLPPELRLLIYTYVLCDKALHIVHIFHVVGRLYAVPCTHSEPFALGLDHRCWGKPHSTQGLNIPPHYFAHREEDNDSGNGRLALLKSCRVM
jgi:hypothetical protein